MKLIQSTTRKQSVLNWLKSAWNEAFPPELDVSEVFKKRKEQSKKQKEIQNKIWSEEELAEFSNKIPNWKKNALVFVKFLEEDQVQKQKKPIFSSYLRRKYKDNNDFQELITEIEGLKTSANVMKDNLTQKIMYSNSEVISASLKVISKVKEKLNNDAIEEMKTKDPNFDFDTFEKEIRYIFEEMYHEFLCHNIEFLEKFCTGEALGHFRVMIQEHLAKFGIPKYTDILNVSYPVLAQSFLADDKTPVFVFSLNFQQIYCLVDPNNPETILDGDEKRMELCDYAFYVIPHPTPDIEGVGHGWLFIKIVQTNKVRQLI